MTIELKGIGAILLASALLLDLATNILRLVLFIAGMVT
jgi:hypothetical protein